MNPWYWETIFRVRKTGYLSPSSFFMSERIFFSFKSLGIPFLGRPRVRCLPRTWLLAVISRTKATTLNESSGCFVGRKGPRPLGITTCLFSPASTVIVAYGKHSASITLKMKLWERKLSITITHQATRYRYCFRRLFVRLDIRAILKTWYRYKGTKYPDF